MNKILQDNEIQILAKVAKRSALLRKAAEEEIWEKNKEFNVYLREQLEANGLNANEILNTPQARDVFVNTLAKSFVYVPTQEAVDRIQGIRDEAYALLPQTIQSEKWKPDTCGCELNAIYTKVNGEADMEGRQTFHSVICPDHQELTLEETHDVVHEENKRKNLVYKHLVEEYEGVLSERKVKEDGTPGALDFKDSVKYEWSWQGSGKNRVLNVNISGANLSKAQKDSVKAFGDNNFGNGKVII